MQLVNSETKFIHGIESPGSKELNQEVIDDSYFRITIDMNDGLI